MVDFMSLAEAAARFAAAAKDVEAAEERVVVTACKMVAAKAKSVLGTGGYGWPRLQPATFVHKTQAGMLLETGALRDSIEWNAEGTTGHVGSNFDRAVFHERGTSKMPARSFLMLSAVAEGPSIARMAGKTIAAAVVGHGSWGHGAHALFKALEILKEFAERIADHVEEGVDGMAGGHRR